MIVLCFIFLCLTILWAVYWAIIRPCLLTRIAIDFERLKSSVDWAIITGLPASQARPALELVTDLADAEASLTISFTMLVWALNKYGPAVRAHEAKEREQLEKMPAWVREAHDRDLQLATTAALANSPLWWPFVALVLLAALFSVKVAQWWNDLRTAAVLLRSEDYAFGA